MRKIAITLILFWSAVAGAVPNTINFTGRLSKTSGPVNGAVNLTLKLYDVASGGTPLWTEIHNNAGANNGLVFVDAGTLSTLDDTVFSGNRLYLEIVVETETLSPRIAINSVPYAMRSSAATNADFLGTSIRPGDVVTSINAGPGVVAAKTGNAVAVSLSTTGCVSGQAYKFNGATFACANDLNTTYTGGAGISVSGTTVSLATTGCTAGSVWKFNGTAFVCAPDANTTYAAGPGVTISAGNQIGVDATVQRRMAAAPMTCPNGFLRTVTADGTSTCVMYDSVGTADSVARGDHTHDVSGQLGANHSHLPTTNEWHCSASGGTLITTATAICCTSPIVNGVLNCNATSGTSSTNSVATCPTGTKLTGGGCETFGNWTIVN